MLIEAAAAILVLAQTVPDRPEVAQAALEEAEHHYKDCLEDSASRVDDGHSDEAAIAAKIEGDCPSHLTVYFRDLKQVHPDDDQTDKAIRHAFALEIVHGRREAALTVVN